MSWCEAGAGKAPVAADPAPRYAWERPGLSAIGGLGGPYATRCRFLAAAPAHLAKGCQKRQDVGLTRPKPTHQRRVHGQESHRINVPLLGRLYRHHPSRDDDLEAGVPSKLVDNPHEHAAAVRGIFIYQRKGAKDTWQNTDTIPLSALKKDEGYRLELASLGLLNLVRELIPLYKLHAKHGIPFGMTEFVPVDSAVANLAALPSDQVRTYLSANKAVGEQLLSTLLAWVAGLPEPTALVPRLLSLGPAALRNLNVAVGLGRLKQALTTWKEHAAEPNEEFWQQTLTEHAFVLEQVFAARSIYAVSWRRSIARGWRRSARQSRTRTVTDSPAHIGGRWRGAIRATGRPTNHFLRPRIPEQPESRIINFDAAATWP
jgi:hypothetical protein